MKGDARITTEKDTEHASSARADAAMVIAAGAKIGIDPAKSGECRGKSGEEGEKWGEYGETSKKCGTITKLQNAVVTVPPELMTNQ